MAPTDKREEPSLDHPSHVAAASRGRALSGSELAGLGVFLAAAFVVPLVAGLVLDGLVHTSPLFLFVGLVAGIGAATLGFYVRLRRYL